MKKISGIISFALSLLMLFSLAAPAFAANKGTADEPFVISSASLTGYSMATGGNFALGKTGSNLSKSYVETNTTGVSYLTAQSVTATGVVVGDKEFVELSVDLPTSIKGSGTLTYNVSNGSKTITGVAQSTTTGVSFNNLVVVQGKTAPVQGYFKSVSGRVRPVGDVTLGGTYTVVGASGEADAKNVTVNGNAIISGYFNKLTVNPSAQVSVIGTTVIGTVEQKEGSNITVNKGVKLTIDGNVMQPIEAQTITSWEKSNGYYLLPAGNYTVASGAWELEGDTTVKSTGSADISVSLEGSTLTVENGTVKARGGAAADATGTVISTAGKVKLSTIEKGVWAYGEFKEISTVVNSVQYPITVPKDKTISAEYKDGDNPVVINSVTVKQDTEFKEWNGILPAGSNYKYENISGSWKGETTDTPARQIAVTYTGNGNSLTITQDNAAVQGTFSELNTGDHEVTVIGDLTADKANAKLKGTEGVSVTIKSGEGALTGAFKDISLKGATPESKFDIDVTKAESLEIESGDTTIKGEFSDSITVKDCSKYAIDVTGKPDLIVSGGEGTVKGVFGNISITDSIYAVTDTTADTLTVVMNTMPQKESVIQGSFGEITVTGDKYALDVTGNPTFTAKDSEGTIKGSLKDITIIDGSYSIADTTAESLTVTMSTVPQNANTVSGAFSKEISLTGDKYVLDVTGSPTLSIQDGEGTITGSFKDIEIKDSAFAIDDEDTSADSLTVDNASVDAVCPINGSYKEISVEDGEFTLNSRAEAVLTVSGGDGTITGKFYKIVMKGGSVVDGTGDTRVEIDHDMSDVNESAIEVMGGELMFRNDPVITVNSDNTTAVQVTGGKLTMENGSIVAIGVAAKAVSVAKGGEVIFGNPELDDRVMPSVMTSGGSSIALYVNKNGTATIYRGSIYFDDESSRGIRVTYGGHVKLYPNDEFGTAHPQWQENPHIHIYGGKNSSAAIWIESMASFEIRGRGALIEEPNSNSDSYALYISSGADTDASIISGGTFNGKIYWDGDDTKSNLNHLIETNHYIRFDGSSADFGWSNGTQGISPDTIDESDTVGSFSGFYGVENEFDGKYTDTVGRRGEYYSVIDAEHELRYAMVNGEPYQIPAGIIYQGDGYDAIELDKNDPTVWAIDKRQGDLDVTGDTAIYLAGRRINYYVDFDYSDPDLVSFNDGENDKLRTIAVTDAGTKLTIVSGVFGAEGTDKQLAANEGGYAASGAISYKGYFSKLGDENTSAIKVESGELTITSGILTGGDSGLYITGGKAVIGTADEDVNNSVILSYAKNQAIRIDGGDVTLNGGANISDQDGVLVESGTLAVNGGLISGTNQYTGSGIHTTGGEVTIAGGALYGNYNTVGGVQSAKDSESGRSLVIDDGTVTVAIDEAHEGYAEDFTLETAKLHHINNIVVNGGTLNYSSARNRNNGALTVTGGTVNYFDGVTVGDTTIYGKEHTEVDDFTTKFFVKDGDFGAFRVTGYNDDNTVAYKTDSFRSGVQLHGGYFTSIETDVLLENGQSTIEEIHGAWKKAKYDGENEETRHVNHYVEAVTSARNERGKWNRNNSIQSGTVYSGVSTAAAGEQEAISVRNAVEEFRAWAEGADADTYKLYTNLWIGDRVCDETFCSAEVEAPVDVKRAEAELELNGFGIYGDKSEPESSVLAISGSAAVKGADNSEIRNLSGNAIVVKTGGELTLDNKAVVIGSSAVTNNGTLTVNEATVSGDNAIINTGAATVNENAEIVGKNEAIISSGTLTVENGVITGTMGEGIISSDTLTVNGGAISGKNGITSSGKLTLNGGTVSGESGILSSGKLTVTDGTVTGTAGDGISTSGDFTMESGTVTGTADGIVKTAGTAALKGGTVSSIKTDGKISDLLDEGMTLSDESGILAGADALARSSIKDGDSSGDEATGGDSVKYDGDEITSVSYDTKFTASFSVAERTFTEITLKANDKVTLSIENAKNAVLDSDSITNGTATVYLDKTGSAEIKATTTAGNSLDSIKVNDKAVSDVAHKKSATVTITAKDSAVTADGKPFGVIIDSASGITVTKDEAAYKYTVTGKTALKPAVQRMNEQDEWEAFEDAVINKTEEGFEVDLGLDSLDSDYRIKAYIVINTAPKSYVITTDEAENGEIESSADSDNAGASVELTLTPDDGYIPVSVEIRDTNDNEVEAELVNGKYVFTMPASDVTVKATFTKKVSRIFDDVSEEDWFDPAVQYCYDNGLIKGTAENLFSPAFNTTRGMIVTILYRIEKEPAVASLADFTDVLSGAWYAESVTWAQQNKIVNGYPDGSFGAEDYITREQFAVILYKYAAHKGYDVTAKADVGAYADASEISDWAVGAVEWANANGFMNGYDGKFSPKGFATRAEAAAIIYRFCTSEAVK